MSTKFKLIKHSDPVERASINWTLCMLCQRKTSESLSQPWRGRGRGNSSAVGTGYQTFAVSIGKFNELGKIPLNVYPDQYNDGSGIEETLLKNKAAWHKTCRNQFSDYKLARKAKRPIEPDNNVDQARSSIKTRRSNIETDDVNANITPLCFFCAPVGSSRLGPQL